MRALLVVPLVLLGLAGCTNTAGPVMLEPGAVSCVDPSTQTDTAFGLYIKNAAINPITITGFSFATEQNVTVVDGWTVPNDSPIGSIGTSAYPPSATTWAERDKVPGAEIDGNTESNFIVRVTLKAGETTGVAKGLTVLYHDRDGQRFSTTSDAVLGYGASCQ